MVDGFHLLRPELLWALGICPVVALALWFRRAHQGDWSRVIDADLLPFLLPDQTGAARRVSVWIPTFAASSRSITFIPYLGITSKNLSKYSEAT